MARRRHTGARTYRRNRARILKPGCVCWLCGKPIDLTITDPYDPGYGTADHVLPVAQGGSDALSNLRPAHRGCNARRQARAPHATGLQKHSRDW